MTAAKTDRLSGAAQREKAVAARVLAAHWHVAIETAEAAIEASLRADLLPGAYCREELEHLRDENRWLERAPFN
jgi:hypothetical protein